MPGALRRVRVLELSNWLAGPHAGMILADLGAEVIKIEPPEGEASRQSTPLSPGGETGYFLNCNRNKKSLVLDLKTPQAKEVFYQLVRRSDVVLDNMRPGAMAKLGLDFETLRRLNPRIICCSISGYGQTGPYRDRRGYDYLLQGIAGIAHMVGSEDGPPVGTRLSIMDLLGGMHAAIGILAALAARDDTGEGQVVDIGLLDCAVSLLTYHITGYFATGRPPRRPKWSAHPHTMPAQIFPTKDGYVICMIPEDHYFRVTCECLGVPAVAGDPRFSKQRFRAQNREELSAIMEERFRTRTSAEWLEVLIPAGVTIGQVNSFEEAMRDPQVLARHAIVEYGHPREGKVTVAGNPVKLSANPEVFRPAPALGEHTHEILGGMLGYTDEEIERVMASGACRPLGQTAT